MEIMRRSAWVTASVWCLAGLVVQVPVLAQEDVLTAEIVVDSSSVSQIALDPRGELVAYTLSVQRSEEDEPGRRYSQLWLVGTREGEARQFTSARERVSSPAFSPDGKSLTFLSKRKEQHEETQIYTIPRRGGEARPLTRHDASISFYRWSPDGRWIAFVDSEPKSKEKKEAEKKGQDWWVFEEADRARRLWLYDVEKEEARELLDEPNVWDVEWSPDGRRLIVQATAVPRTDESYMDRKLYSVALPDGKLKPLASTQGKLGPMAVAPDGRQLAFLGAVSRNDPLTQSLFVASTEGGAARLLTDGYLGSAQNLAWLDEETVLLQAVERERSVLYLVDAGRGTRTSVSWPSHLVINQVKAMAGTGAAAVVAHSHSHPAALYVTPRFGTEPDRRTDHNPELEGIRLAGQEVFTWKGAEGWDMSGVLTYPLDYRDGESYPLVLQIHGGPEGVSMNGWSTRPTYPVQLLAREGFVVLEPNYRGSQGRGVEFSKADHDDLGGKEFEDVLRGIDALVERGLVDGDRVGTGGWSYGGYFSAWAATRHSARFQASMVGAGLSNWISFAGTTDIPHEMSLVHWNSYWFDEPELHWQRSPIAHLDKARTPTLIVHGLKDERVHPEQSIELHTALRLKGIPTSLVLYPRAPHGLSERAHELDYIERLVGWFKKYLQPGMEEIPSGR